MKILIIFPLFSKNPDLYHISSPAFWSTVSKTSFFLEVLVRDPRFQQMELQKGNEASARNSQHRLLDTPM